MTEVIDGEAVAADIRQSLTGSIENLEGEERTSERRA
jgi:hypothetical protein